MWKRVDKLYLDRTFNGQDWFALRQTAMKKKYKTTQEVYDSIKVGPSLWVGVWLRLYSEPYVGAIRTHVHILQP